jgi:hypothetical protein
MSSDRVGLKDFGQFLWPAERDAVAARDLVG